MGIPTAGTYIRTEAQVLPSSSLTDFSLLVDLSQIPSTQKTSFFVDVNTTDGTKGRVSNLSGTELPSDWIDFDNSAQTGIIRIKYTGTLPTTGTVGVFIYSPNTRNVSYAATDTYGQYNAYDSSWVGYWTLSGDAKDRTSTQNNGVENGGVSVGGASGVIGSATQFDGTDDWIQLSPVFPGGKNNYEIFAWYKGTKTIQTFFGQASTLASSPRFIVRSNSATEYSAFSGSSFPSWTTSTHIDGSFHMLGFGSDGNSGTQGLSIDSSLGGSNNDTPFGSGTYDNAGIAGVNRGGTLYNLSSGVYQNVSAHDVFRGNNWRLEEYSQINDNATFWGNWTSGTIGGGGYDLIGDTGTFNITGNQIDLLLNRVLSADSVSFAITGQDADLSYIRGYNINAESGSFNISGNTAGIILNRVLGAESGSLNITGQDADLSYTVGYRINAESGNISITGQDVTFLRDYVMAAGSAEVNINGQNATLLWSGETGEIITTMSFNAFVTKDINYKSIVTKELNFNGEI